MNLKEKASLLSGKDVWHTASIEKLDIKSIMMADGPHGLRKQVDSSDNLGLNSSYKATLFPSAAAVACSFNTDMAYKMGKAIGKEARGADVQVVLGPGINIKRNPMCGRNFEYYSEDPYVSGVMGEAWIRGLQSQNVGASLKHFAANNQETYRHISNSVIDMRALREIYLKNFEIAIKANPATVMCSYNKLNGIYASESYFLLTQVLRSEWGYKGLVVSDWGAVSNRVLGLINGLDLEMPSSRGYNTKKIIKAHKKEYIVDNDIDSSVKRVLDLVNKYVNNKNIPYDFEVHHQVSQKIARESIVLLRNENKILPLKKDEKIALVGAFAKHPRVQGGGSSYINPHKIENVFDEIVNYTNNYQYFQGYTLDGDGYDQSLVDEIVNIATSFDKIIIMTGLPESYETEGFDRDNIDLPLGHLKLIDAIIKVNKNIIITLYIGSQVAMPFKDEVQAILNCHLLGSASAVPLLDILFGKVSPSGRLATTYPIDILDDPSTKNFADGNNAVLYEESIFVGYRYYTTFKQECLYPFGYGLSYSDFEYSDLTVSSDTINPEIQIEVKVKVKNVGTMPASEVVQLYVGNNRSSVYKAVRELRAFEKVHLEIGEEKEVTFTLNYSDFSYYDIYMKKFHVNMGTYKIQICKDAAHIIMQKEISRLENEPGYEDHYQTGYNKHHYEVTTTDFQYILGRPVPLKNTVKKRPFSMDSTLNDVKQTFVGNILYHKVLSEAKKLNANSSDEWMKKVIDKTLMEMPLRNLAYMSGGKISLTTMERLVDMINFRYLRGLFKR